MSPLEDPSYLLSTVETITSSLYEQSSVSVHDLLDAYATFVNRLRSQTQLLNACNSMLPALAPLKIRKDAFVRVLRRDVHLAHIDPLSTLPRPHLSIDDPFLVCSIHLKADAKQYARDSSSLCHHALCVLMTICRFTAFHFVFPEHDLSALFGDVLHIALAEQLPVLNEAKTYSLSLWALGSHHLPVTVLDSWRDALFSSLQQSLDGTKQPGNILLDGLKAISHTIEHRPSGFLDLLSPLLPDVMANLHCEASELRLHASVALGKFANALIHQTELSLTKWQTLSDHVVPYLESCCNESQAVPAHKSFLRIVRAAFSTEPHACSSRVAPTWILAVLASLIVLCGPSLYRKPKALRCVFQALAMTLQHKRSILRAFHPHVWRCFIWTFNRMLSVPEKVEPALISSAFHAIKQEVRGGIGMAFVNILLSDQITTIRSVGRDDRVSQALSVIKAMVRTDCKHTRREGFMLLQAFTNPAQVQQQILQDMYEIPASVLLNGAIIGAKWDTLPSTIHSIPKVLVSVHWLEETEIAQHYKTLLVIWKQFATPVDGTDMDSGLVDVWLSILLACSNHLDRRQHITATTDVPRYMAAIIVEFLPSAPLADCQSDCGSNWGSRNAQGQRCRLTFMDRLWSAMRKAFVGLSLTEAAEHILGSILRDPFHLLDPGVRTVWSRLCAKLMAIVSASFLRNVHDHAVSHPAIRSQGELWGVVATSLSFPEPGLDWKELVNFLTIPVCARFLPKPELETWEALFRTAIALSGDFAMAAEHPVLQYLQEKDVGTWETTIAILSLLLTCAHEHGNAPTADLLAIVDGCLITSYSRASHSLNVLTHSLELLNVIRHVIVSAPSKVMQVLQALCSGLCLWIEDHDEVMSNEEFNSVVVALYCETLEALEVLPLSIQSLQDMEIFLASAFSRIPTPAIAPFAFERFWRATYHGHGQFCDNILPPKIKSCLACFVAAYGGDLADGLSLTTGSQSQGTEDGSFASLAVNTDGLHSRRDGAQVHLPTSPEHQVSAGFSLRLSPSSTPSNPGFQTEAVGVTPPGHPQVFTDQKDTVPILPSSDDDDSLQPTILRQLQEYSSRIDPSSPSGLERSTIDPEMRLSPTASPSCVMPSSHSLKSNHPAASYEPRQKQKPAADNDYAAPRKRSRTSRDTLRSVRKLESEPTTRDVTPVNGLRMNSVPLKKRKVFDGVEVPTLREISRRKMMQGANASANILDTIRRPMPTPQTPPNRSAQKRRRASSSPLPSFVGSNEEDLDWEDVRVEVTSSEVDVDRSLEDDHTSSPPRTRPSAQHERDGKSHLPTGSSLPKVLSQSKSSPSAPSRPSMRRAKTTSARLDALRDVYASVASGASQIPMSELVQATKLVHQIGAVLTEQMSKKTDGPG